MKKEQTKEQKRLLKVAQAAPPMPVRAINPMLRDYLIAAALQGSIARDTACRFSADALAADAVAYADAVIRRLLAEGAPGAAK